MARSFISRVPKEDVQEETFNFLAHWSDMAAQSWGGQSPEDMWKCLKILFAYVYMRLDDKEQIEKELEEVSDMLFKETEVMDDSIRSEALDKLYVVWLKINLALEQVGILFKMRVDPGEIIKHGGGN